MRHKNVVLWLLTWMWQIACQAVKLLGRTGAIAVGVVMIIIGFLMSLSIIGVIIGVPLIVFGAMFIICGIWKGKGIR